MLKKFVCTIAQEIYKILYIFVYCSTVADLSTFAISDSLIYVIHEAQ